MMRFLKRHEPASLAQILWALVVVVLAIKLAKVGYRFIDAYGYGPAKESWLLRAVLISLACYAVSRLALLKRPPLERFRPILIAMPALIVFAGKAMLAILARKPAHAFGWISRLWIEGAVVGRVLYNALRADLIFLASFALIAHGLSWLASERLRPRVHKAIGFVVAFCIVFSGLEVAQFAKTGLPATGRLLGFFVTNASGIAPMLLSQIDGVTIPILLAPILLGVAISRVVLERPLIPPMPRAWLSGGLAALVLVASLVHLKRIDHQFDQFSEDTFLALRDLAPWRSNGELEAKRRAARMPPLFETRQAKLRPKGAPPTKNVVIIMLESTRADSTTLYNPKLDTTPFMVEFAKRGATLSTMYAGAPRTNGAWVSAVYGVPAAPNNEIKAMIRSPRPALTSFPTLLEPFGYSSAFFTSAFLNFMYDDELVRAMRFGTIQDGHSLPQEGFEQVSYTGHDDRQVLKPALSWVRQQKEAHKPFFLMWMTNVGHFPFTPPTTWPSRAFDEKDEARNHYLNCVAYIDTIVREFIKGLDELGVMDDSIVLVLGDHGESMGEHGPRVHTLCIYDETLRIPAVLYAPGQIQPGSSITGLRQEIDIMPTFLELLGVEIEQATLTGIPFTRPVAADRTLYFGGEEGSQFLAMRRGDTKFIYSYERSPTEAYSLSQDPDERRDLAPTMDHKVIEDAEAEMLLWHERVCRATSAPPSQ